MSETSITEASILESLGQVNDPEIGRSLTDLKMLKKANVQDGGRVELEVVLPTPAYPQPERITAAIREVLTAKLPDIRDVAVAFSHEVRGKNPGSAIGQQVKNILAVGSGKGGVGKSTIAASLAYGLKQYGARVGLMDADVYGPSIPHLVGASGQPAVIERKDKNGQTMQRIVPIEADGMQLMSLGFMIEKEQAVIWRGPMLHKLLTQFLQQTDWNELDYLIIDLPPGTGDVSLTLSQLVGLAGAVVVCTPQQVALLDAVKAISMFRQVKIPVLGIVENMSGDIFGRGGARQQAETSGIPFLGEIPSNAEIRIKGDEGQISRLFEADNPAREPLLRMCEQVALQVVKQHLDEPGLPNLEVL